MNKAFLLCVLSYVLSLFAAVISSSFFIDGHLWKAITVGHLVATLIIYIASVLAKNSSFYDPFWSIAPLPIVLFLSFLSYEKDKNLIEELDTAGILNVEGNATTDETLIKAGVLKAKNLR